MPLQALSAPGLKWKDVGTEKPISGKEIKHDRLAAALHDKFEFTEQELAQLTVSDLSYNDYIMVDSKYLKPIEVANKTNFYTPPVSDAFLPYANFEVCVCLNMPSLTLCLAFCVLKN